MPNTDSPTGPTASGGDGEQAEQVLQLQQPGASAQDGPPEGGPREEVDHPAKLLRIAAMVQTTLNQVRTAELDEAGRERLTSIHNRMLDELSELLSEDLRAELSEFELEPVDDLPTGAELRVVQAQLSGWLQGLFHGIQASIASQQMAAREQLARMQQQLGPGQGQGEGGSSGHYL